MNPRATYFGEHKCLWQKCECVRKKDFGVQHLTNHFAVDAWSSMIHTCTEQRVSFQFTDG